MKTAKTRDINRSLLKKGFRIADKRDHTYYFLYIGNKKTSVFTKMSHGKEEIPMTLLKLMAQQVKLSDEQFADLINCPLSYDKYIEILKSNGYIHVES